MFDVIWFGSFLVFVAVWLVAVFRLGEVNSLMRSVLDEIHDVGLAEIDRYVFDVYPIRFKEFDKLASQRSMARMIFSFWRPVDSFIDREALRLPPR